MTTYCTPSDMAVVATGGWEELAQRAAQDGRVTGELLRGLYEGSALSGQSAEVRRKAQEALDLLVALCDKTSRFADTFIAVRYRTPLATETVAAADLTSVVATIAVLRLHGVAATEDVRAASKWAFDYLNAVQSGRASLGRQQVQGNDPVTLATFSGRAVTDIDLNGY